MPRSHGAQNFLSPASAKVTLVTSGALHSGVGVVGSVGEETLRVQPTDVGRGLNSCWTRACLLEHGTSIARTQTSCETSTPSPTALADDCSAIVPPSVALPATAWRCPWVDSAVMAPLAASMVTLRLLSAAATVSGAAAAPLLQAPSSRSGSIAPRAARPLAAIVPLRLPPGRARLRGAAACCMVGFFKFLGLAV